MIKDDIPPKAYLPPTTAENSAKKERGRPFKPGQSGNPKGKPKGCRHKATRAALELLSGDLETITEKLVEKAKAGQGWAIKLVIDKLVAPAKDNPIIFKTPRLEKTEDLRKALGSILKAVGKGELTPQEAVAVAEIINGLGLALAVEDLEREFEQLTPKGG